MNFVFHYSTCLESIIYSLTFDLYFDVLLEATKLNTQSHRLAELEIYLQRKIK